MVSFKELIEDSKETFGDSSERRLTISDVSWETYELILAKLKENSHYRVTYLDEILEIVSPSKKHENVKSRIGFLLEFYFCKKKINHFSMGSTTVRNRLKQAGVEPDECYCIGEEKEIPDLAIEVTITSGSIKKLETYSRLGVKEVWFWKKNKFSLYYLHDLEELKNNFGYEEIQYSELVPELNIEFLSKCVTIPNQVDAWEQFEKEI
ncbi:MAG: Uma2 family endonuclease [Cyanobacteria bacterium P01_D01_bin.50]